METEGLSLDKINTLPATIIEHILTLMPIRDALRTSILSKKWQYSWQSMPKLVFTDDMVKVTPFHLGWIELKKYKLVNAIFHVLLLHNGPTILEFHLSFDELDMVSEFDQIITHLSRRNTVKKLTVMINGRYYNLPVSFFSMKGLECITLQNCVFEPPLAFNGFSRLRRVVFISVMVSANMLKRFLSNCPLLEDVYLNGEQQHVDFVTEGNMFTLADLFRCVPMIFSLGISRDYIKYLSAGSIPHKLLTSLARLSYIYLEACLMEHNEISSAFCMFRSSPLLVGIDFLMCDNAKSPVQKTPTNFLDLEDHSDLKLDNLEYVDIHGFSNFPIEKEFVKLIMAKSPALKKVQLALSYKVSIYEELNILREWLLPFPRASPSAKLVIGRPFDDNEVM